MCTTAQARGDCLKRRGYVCRGTRCVRRRRTRVSSNSRSSNNK